MVIKTREEQWLWHHAAEKLVGRRLEVAPTPWHSTCPPGSADAEYWRLCHLLFHSMWCSYGESNTAKEIRLRREKRMWCFLQHCCTEQTLANILEDSTQNG